MKYPLSAIVRHISRPALLSGLKKKWRDERGMAAVEFALILPVMLTSYLGAVAVTKGIHASRRIDLATHALADLTSQQLTCTANQALAPCLVSGDISSIISAAKAIIAPLDPALLKITLSQMQIYTFKTGAKKTVAYVNWSMAYKGATARKCSSGGEVISPETNAALQKAQGAVSPAETGFENKIPSDFLGVPSSGSTAAAPANPGYLIVADVVYPYTPLFSFGIGSWSNATAIKFGRSHFVRSRSLGVSSTTPTPISFYPPVSGTATIAPEVNLTYCKVYT